MLQSLFRMSLAMYTLYLYNNHVGKFSFILLVILAMIFSRLPIQKMRFLIPVERHPLSGLFSTL